MPACTGLADKLKFFTFANGTFQASQLDYAAAIPEPACRRNGTRRQNSNASV